MASHDFRKGVFISYSHRDQKWLETLEVFLKPYTLGEGMQTWSDKRLVPGDEWMQKINETLDSSRVAVILVSPYFLASDFIMGHEFPPILRRVKEGSLILYWIAVSYSAYKDTPLAAIQSANDPLHPLDSLSISERNRVLTEVAEKIGKAMDINAVGNMLKMIDDFVEADNKEKGFDTPRGFAQQARQQGDEIRISDRKTGQETTITAEDLNQLDSHSQMLIRAYENTMQDLFERWVELQPRSYSRDPAIKQKARGEMAEVRIDLCAQLDSILGYLYSINKPLADHYEYARHICTQPG